MIRILPPDAYETTPWKNGGGTTHEIARADGPLGWSWRLSVAEVANDGPFSRFDGMARILTVIDGAGIDLHMSGGVLRARFGIPVAFAGDVPVDGRLEAGPIRDFNVIYDPALVRADVRLQTGGICITGPGITCLLCLEGEIRSGAQTVPQGGCILADTAGAQIELCGAARALLARIVPVG